MSDNLKKILDKAFDIANEYHHKNATHEHLLLALLEDSDTQKLFDYYLINVDVIIKKLQHYLKNDLSELVEKNINQVKPTNGFQRVVQRASLHNDLNAQEIKGIYLLAEFFFENDIYAVVCLQESNLTRRHVLQYLSKNLVLKTTNNSNSIRVMNKRNDKELRMPKNLQHPFNSKKVVENESELDKYCVNLNLKAQEGAIDRLIGRQNEIQRTIEILCRRRKNNALLVGEPGVGKTAIAEGLAFRIVQGDVPEILKESIVYALDLGSLVSGAKYRGDFEERIKKIFAEIKSKPEIILFIDEIHMMIGAGSTVSGSMDASNLLKPVFARGELRCIGSTTFREYHNHFEKDMALVRRFQKVIVGEPDKKTTIEILHGLKEYYEQYHNVKYDDDAIEAAVVLSIRYISDRHLPDKAIDLMDEAGARKNISFISDRVPVVVEKDIEELVAKIVNIPSISIGDGDITQLRQLENNLKNCIFGQDEAINILCSSIKLSRAGLKKSSRPTGSYLFAGASGVGKTELAKQLAKFCNMELIQLDMSEFSESHSISKLLGSPPGYSGFEQGGQLTDEVDKYQYSVVLFDEIEKAHPEILNLLLQIMDEGTLTDNTGKIINFTHTIIILTTNLGVKESNKTPIGFGADHYETKHQAGLEALNLAFSPELRNRLDNIIVFNSLNENIINMIIEKNLEELSNQLAERNVEIVITNSAIKYLSANCLAKKNGARALDRMIDKVLKQPIADEILFGKLKDGGRVKITVDKVCENKLKFKFSKNIRSEIEKLAVI